MITSTYAQQNELLKFGFLFTSITAFTLLQVDTPVMMSKMKYFAKNPFLVVHTDSLMCELLSFSFHCLYLLCNFDFLFKSFLLQSTSTR